MDKQGRVATAYDELTYAIIGCAVRLHAIWGRVIARILTKEIWLLTSLTPV
jgi:hypothetical protein